MNAEPTPEERFDGALSRLSSKVSKVRFDELIAYATNACLKVEPDYYYPESELTVEQKIVDDLGVRGVKAAMELSHGHMLHTPEKTPKDLEENAVRIDLMLPVTHPWLVSMPISREVLYKAERFGEGLLQEAYKVLGQDVYAKIAELKQATTPEEQIEVVEWLDARIKQMTSSKKTIDAQDDEEETNRKFYHPVRLSPKIIGVYPEHNLRPTCLSISIIASSFFEKAGLTTMHAAVNESSIDKSTGNALRLLEKILTKHAKKLSIPFSDKSTQAIQSVALKAHRSYVAEEAQHAAVYAQLLDQTWVQFDPNFHSTGDITPELKDVNQKLTDVYNQLDGIRELAPGIEISTLLLSNVDLTEVITILLDSKTEKDVALIRERSERALSNMPNEAVQAWFYEQCVRPFFSETDSPLLLEAFRYLDEATTRHAGSAVATPVLEDLYYEMFNKYVLWGDSLEEFMRRVKIDSSYRQHRADDIACLPFMISVALAKKVAEERTGDHIHRKVELGLPASRIGLAALNDFAVYSEDDISLGFWMSHWSGGTSVTQHYDKEATSDDEARLQYVNTAHYLVHPFTNNRNSEIIESFLATHPHSNTDKKENEDGNQQEGP